MSAHEIPIENKKARIAALAEVGLVFFFFNILKPSHYLLHRSGILDWELKNLGWSYLGGALLIAIPVMLILIKHQPLREYGIHLEFIDLSLDLGLKGYLASFIPWLAGFGLLMGIGSGYDQPAGALVLSLCYLLAAWLLFRWTRNLGTDTHYPTGFRKRQLATYAILLAFPLLLAAVMQRFTLHVPSTLIWQLVFSGFGEEIYWRGYFQSRLTQAFGRPWQCLGIRFGAGLIIASLLFGISHGLNATNLLAGETGFSLSWAIWTCFSGLFFGLLREKSEGILAPALVHGVIDGVGETLAILFHVF